MELSHLEIQTERLTLRPLTIDDVEAIHQIWIDAGVRKFMWDDEIISFEEASAVIEKSVKYFRCKGFGLWAVLPRDEDRIIGLIHQFPELKQGFLSTLALDLLCFARGDILHGAFVI